MYGEPVFIFQVIEYVENENDLPKREGHYCHTLDACNPDKGYNLSAVDETGSVRPSEESRLKMSLAQPWEKIWSNVYRATSQVL